MANKFSPSVSPRFDWTVYSTDYTQSFHLGEYTQSKVQWKWLSLEQATITVPEDHPYGDYLMSIDPVNPDDITSNLNDPGLHLVPMRTYYNRRPWSGVVTNSVRDGPVRRGQITVTLTSDKQRIHNLLGFPQPLLPVEVQIPPEDIFLGPLNTLGSWFVARNATRLGVPVCTVVPNTLAVDANGDGPPFVTQFTRMNALDETFNKQMAPYDWGWSCDLWTPDQASTWNPKVFNPSNLSRLQNIIDITGNNFLWFTNRDNRLSLLDPSTWNRPGPGAMFIFDINPKKDGKYKRFTTAGNMVDSYKTAVQWIQTTSVIVGGKSPTWINDIVKFLANLAISELLSAIGLFGVGGVVGDELDDILFAFEKFDNNAAKAALGAYGPGERFLSSSAAYTLDAFQAGFQELTKAGGKKAVEATIIDGGADGRGYRFGSDDGSGRFFDIGEIVTFEDDHQQVHDFISEVNITDDRQTVLKPVITVGDQQAIMTAFDKLMGVVSNIAALANALSVTH